MALKTKCFLKSVARRRMGRLRVRIWDGASLLSLKDTTKDAGV